MKRPKLTQVCANIIDWSPFQSPLDTFVHVELMRHGGEYIGRVYVGGYVYKPHSCVVTLLFTPFH